MLPQSHTPQSACHLSFTPASSITFFLHLLPQVAFIRVCFYLQPESASTSFPSFHSSNLLTPFSAPQPLSSFSPQISFSISQFLTFKSTSIVKALKAKTHLVSILQQEHCKPSAEQLAVEAVSFQGF